MIAYVTFLLLLLILTFPVTFIIALIINLFRLPKMVREMLRPYRIENYTDENFSNDDFQN